MGETYRIKISGKHTGKSWHLRVTRIRETEQIVQFRVDGRDRHLVLQSCYPLFRAKKLLRRKLVWKVVEGHISSLSFVESIGEVLTNIVKGQDEANRSHRNPYER